MALEIADDSVQTRTLDHHGLVASVCKEPGLADKINQRIGSDDPRRIVQPGTSVIAMIINGLGFTNRRLYLTPQFFESKPLDILFDGDIEAKDPNEKALGKALDAISGYGEMRFFWRNRF